MDHILISQSLQESLRRVVIALQEINKIECVGSEETDRGPYGSYFKMMYKQDSYEGRWLPLKLNESPFEDTFERRLFCLINCFINIACEQFTCISEESEQQDSIREYMHIHSTDEMKKGNGPISDEMEEVYSRIFVTLASHQTRLLFVNNENFHTLEFCIDVIKSHIVHEE